MDRLRPIGLSLADGMTGPALLARYASVLRPKALRWNDWTEGQFGRVFSSLEWLGANTEGVTGRVDIGTIAFGCALGTWIFGTRTSTGARVRRGAAGVVRGVQSAGVDAGDAAALKDARGAGVGGRRGGARGNARELTWLTSTQRLLPVASAGRTHADCQQAVGGAPCGLRSVGGPTYNA